MLSLSMLEEGVVRQRLLVVAGAGISVLAPSNLASWWGFNEALLDAIKGLAREFLPTVADAINRLSLDSLPVQAFSDLVVKSFAGDSYFPLLQVLESERTNANRRALAELGRRGTLRGVVTPNFDTLIERAFREAAVPLDLHVTREHFLRVPRANVCRLYKIHGSVTHTSTLVDTVSQKKRGLPVFLRERIEQEFAGHHLLVMGFSGADLQFDDSYLPFEIAADAGWGVTWLIRPGSREKLPARARAVIERMGDRCALIEDELPGFFARLGVKFDLPEDAPKSTGGGDMRGEMDKWVRAPHIGPPSCAAFCARVFDIVGDDTAARQLIAAIRTAAGVAGPAVSVQAGLCLQVLAIDCIKRGQHDEAVQWLTRQVQFFDAFRQLLTADDREESPQAKTERLQNQAGVFNNLGLCLRMSGKLDDASRALQEATRLCQEAGYTQRMGTIVLNQALIAESRGRSTREVLDMLALAKDWASRSGDVTTEVEAALAYASTCAKMGEYDAATECLDGVEPLLGIIGAPQHAVQLTVQRADLCVRRGSEEEALRLLTDAAETQPAGSSLRRAVDWQLVRLLMHSAPHRAVVVARLNALLLHDGMAAVGVPDNEVLTKVRDALRDGHGDIKPVFLWHAQPASSADDRLSDEELRRRLVLLEYLGRADLIPAFLNELAFRHYEWPRHQKRLARATVEASRRVGNAEHLANGLNHLGVASDLLGELDESIRAYEDALETALPKQRASAMANLALVRSRTVDLGSARRLFEDCITELDQQGHVEQATRSRMCLATRLADEGEFDQAIVVGQRALGDARQMSHEAATRTLGGLVAEWEAARTKAKPAASADSVTATLHSVAVDGQSLTREELEVWRTTVSGAPDLANLAIAEIDFGDEQQALGHLAEARRLYEEAGDQLGLSRCCNNMAGLFHARKQWSQAISWSEMALRLRQERMDWPGVVLTLSNLTSYCVAAERWREAVAYADQCAAYDGTVSEPRHFAIAWIYRAWAHGALGEIPEARRALREAEVRMAALADEQLQRLLHTIASAIPPAPQPVDGSEPGTADSPLLTTLREVERLKALGQYERAHTTLDVAERELGGQPSSALARLIGTRGNVLQRSGKHQEAVDAFRRAAEMFRELGSDDGAASAELNATTSLRELGKIQEARQSLVQLAERTATGPRRAEILVRLAKSHWQPLYLKGQLNRDSPEFHEALRLYAEAQSCPDLPSMLRGIIALDVGQLQANHGDRALGVSQIREAKIHFIDANAPEADVVSDILQKLAADDA